MQSIYEATKDIEGWLLPEDVSGLYGLARKFGGVILEVGTFRGKSAAVLTAGAASKWRRRKPQFFSLDINPAARLTAKEVLKALGLHRRAVFFHGALSKFRHQFPITPTMAFIDGDHTYEGVMADLAELSTMLRADTPVVFHDYLNADTPGVAEAVDEWCEQGFARKVGTFGCCAHVETTAKCSGRSVIYPDRDFRAAAMPRRSIKEKVGLLMPWLVPIVRRLRGKAAN